MKEIKLTRGHVALVDDGDYDYLNQWKWHSIKGSRTYYAVRNISIGNGKTIGLKMHRVILNITDPDILADHKDRNGLNNQRYNLRIATKSQNGCNRLSASGSTSAFVGVHWAKYHNKWRAKIGKGGKQYHLGYFETMEEAALAYNEAAKILHLDFANLNKVI